jgi:hypothetical protein
MLFGPEEYENWTQSSEGVAMSGYNVPIDGECAILTVSNVNEQGSGFVGIVDIMKEPNARMGIGTMIIFCWVQIFPDSLYVNIMSSVFVGGG